MHSCWPSQMRSGMEESLAGAVVLTFSRAREASLNCPDRTGYSRDPQSAAIMLVCYATLMAEGVGALCSQKIRFEPALSTRVVCVQALCQPTLTDRPQFHPSSRLLELPTALATSEKSSVIHAVLPFQAPLTSVVRYRAVKFSSMSSGFSHYASHSSSS